MKYFQWTPNMYIIFVAPPGIVSKSTTASIGMNLLRQVEGVKFGPNAVTWQALIHELQEAKELYTVEGEDLYHVQSALTCVCSEFGNFLNPHDREMVDALVSLWDGQVGVWSKVTKTQGSNLIENPWINVLACTTPDWIAGNFPDYLVGGGFTSRCVFIYADEKRKLVPYPKYENVENFDELELQLVQDLAHIADTLAGEYQLSPDARRFGEDWYKRHYENPPDGLMGGRFGGYIARKQTHIHKLAMVLAAAEYDALIIERRHLAAAVELVAETEANLPKVFSRIGVDLKQRDFKDILLYVWAKGEVSNVDLYRRAMAKFKYKDFLEGLDSAAALRIVRKIDRAGKIFWAPGENHPD
jgi:hypothetical protein